MNLLCIADTCPVLLCGKCVFYEGDSLVYIGVNNNDNYITALQKIDAAIGNIVVGATDWGEIGGNVTDQIDLIAYLSTNYYPLLGNPSNFLNEANLIAGSGISITGTYPNITISSSGGGGTWGSITGTITDQTDLINYLVANYYSITNPDEYLNLSNLTAGTGISITGTYPNITITATGASAVWGNITGTITDQTDLINYLVANYYPLSSNPANYLVAGDIAITLAMPSAFTVTGSPTGPTGGFTVTGAGVASQYVRGDGSLGNFPSIAGGGASVNYYLNGSVPSGVVGYEQMSKTPVIGTGTDYTISSPGYIASFLTDALDPGQLSIPAGNWIVRCYFQSSSPGGSPSFYVELYKYDGSFTLLASSSANPEVITGGTVVDLYTTALAVPATTLSLTDRLAIRIYVNNASRTITLHTEDNNIDEITTTFSTGITALNGLTQQVQYLAVGTSGSDFNIVSLLDTHTFNLPTASATIRGALSSTDWSTFNGKQDSGLSWLLTSGGVLTADNTISGNYNKFFTGTESFVIGHTAVIGSSRFQVRGKGTTTGNLILFEDNSGTERFKILDNGKAYLSTTPTNDESLVQILARDASTGEIKYRSSLSVGGLEPTHFDGQGGVVLVNSYKYFRAASGGTISGWSIIADGTSPTCTIEIYKIASGTTLPSSSITAGAPPQLTTGNAIKSTSMPGWTLTFNADDIFLVKVTACSAALSIDFLLYS